MRQSDQEYDERYEGLTSKDGSRQYGEEELEEIKKGMGFFFEHTKARRKANTNARNYKPLADAINHDKFEGQKNISPSYLRDIFKDVNVKKDKHSRKMDAIISFLSAYQKKYGQEKKTNNNDSVPISTETNHDKKSQIVEELKQLYDEVENLRRNEQFEEVEKLYQLEKEYVDKIAIYTDDVKEKEHYLAKINLHLAVINRKIFFDFKKECEVLSECLRVFENHGSEVDIFDTKLRLAIAKLNCKEYTVAEMFAEDYINYIKPKKDLYGIAEAYRILGCIQIARNINKGIESIDEAIKYGIQFISIADKTDKTQGFELLHLCYSVKSNIYTKQKKLDEAKLYLQKANECHKKKIALAGENENFEENYLPPLNSLLSRIIQCLTEVRANDSLIKRTEELLGKQDIPELGEHELKIIDEAIKEISKINHTEKIASLIYDTAGFFCERDEILYEKKYLSYLIKFSTENKFNYFSISGHIRLAEILDKEKNIPERNIHLETGYLEIDKALMHEENNINKALLLAYHAHIYEIKGNTIGEIGTWEQMAKIFEDEKDIGNFTGTMLKLAHLHDQCGDIKKAANYWLDVIKQTKGTSFYENNALANECIGILFFQVGINQEAKLHLETAKNLYSNRPGLQKGKVIDVILALIDKKEILKNKITISFEQIVNEIFILLHNASFSPLNNTESSIKEKVKDWYVKYRDELIKIFYQNDGLKAIIYSAHFESIAIISESLHWLFDCFIIPAQTVRKETENKGIPYGMVTGFSYPDYATEFIKANTAKHIINTKSMVLDIPYFSSSEEVIANILLCRDFGCIPVYINNTPFHKKAIIISKVEVEVPFTENVKSQIPILVKKRFNSLIMACLANEKYDLKSLKLDFLELFRKEKRKISMEILVFEFSHIIKITYPVIVLNYNR